MSLCSLPSRYPALHLINKSSLDQVNFKTNTNLSFSPPRWPHSPLTGSIRTAAGTAADSAPRTAATASWRSSGDDSPLRSVCDGDTDVHVRLVNCLRATHRRGFMERTARHPSARAPSSGAPSDAVTALGGKKSLLARFFSTPSEPRASHDGRPLLWT